MKAAQQHRQPNEKAFWESHQYDNQSPGRNQNKTQMHQSGFPAAEMSNLGAMMNSYDASNRTSGGMTPVGSADDRSSRVPTYHPPFGVQQETGQIKASGQGSEAGSVAGNPDSSLSFATETTYSGQSLRSEYGSN